MGSSKLARELLMTAAWFLFCIGISAVLMTPAESAAVRDAEMRDGYLYLILDVRDLGDQTPLQKRGIDFGLGRGYSGSQAARHMMGLHQASYAGGPGRK